MRKDGERPDVARRDILKGLGLAAGTAAAAPALIPSADAAETQDEQLKGRYQLTEHVKRFYALNRL